MQMGLFGLALSKELQPMGRGVSFELLKATMGGEGARERRG